MAKKQQSKIETDDFTGNMIVGNNNVIGLQFKHYFIVFGGLILISYGAILVFGIFTVNAILSGTGGSADSSELASSPQSLPPSNQETIIELKSSACDANIEILNNFGDVVLSTSISQNISYNINLPAGSYTYYVKYECSGGLEGTAGSIIPDYSEDFYLLKDSEVKINSPKKRSLFNFMSDHTSNQKIGIILIIIGICFLFYVIGKKLAIDEENAANQERAKREKRIEEYNKKKIQWK